MIIHGRLPCLVALLLSLGAGSVTAQTDDPAGTTGAPAYGGTLTLNNATFWSGNATPVTGVLGVGALSLAGDPLGRATLSLPGVMPGSNSLIAVMTPTTSSSTALQNVGGTSLALSNLGASGLSGGMLHFGNVSGVNGINTMGLNVVTTAPTTSVLPEGLVNTGGTTTSGALVINGGTSLTGATLTLSNLGTVTLTGATTQTIATGTTMLRGTLLGGSTLNITSGTMVAGQTAVTTPVTVSNGATLALQSGITLSAGLNLQRTGTLSVDLGGGVATAAAGGLTVGGEVILTGNLVVTAPANVAAGASFVILNKTSAGIIAGTFAGSPQGSVVSVSGKDFIISYTGGDGNDVTLTALSKAQAWRKAHFNTVDDVGSAADAADADADGIPNLIERACNLDPSVGSPLPVTTARTAENLEYIYRRSVAAVNAGDVFLVEWNDSLTAASWSSLGVTQEVQSDDGTIQVVKATVPAGSSRQRFLRLKVVPGE